MSRINRIKLNVRDNPGFPSFPYCCFDKYEEWTYLDSLPEDAGSINGYLQWGHYELCKEIFKRKSLKFSNIIAICELSLVDEFREEILSAIKNLKDKKTINTLFFYLYWYWRPLKRYKKELLQFLWENFEDKIEEEITDPWIGIDGKIANPDEVFYTREILKEMGVLE